MKREVDARNPRILAVWETMARSQSFRNGAPEKSRSAKTVPHCVAIKGSDGRQTRTEIAFRQEQTMTPKKNRRWMTNVISEAAKCDVQMPWARGPRRAATIARREEAQKPRALRAS
jgi:hypothetical protein